MNELIDGKRTLKVGQKKTYTSRSGAGKGKIVQMHMTQKGPYVTLFDAERAKNVSVRPSQVA